MKRLLIHSTIKDIYGSKLKITVVGTYFEPVLKENKD